MSTQPWRGCVRLRGSAHGHAHSPAAFALLGLLVMSLPQFAPLTAYVHMHALDGASEAVSRLRADALQALRDELASLSGVRVSPVPLGADLDVEITNVLRGEEGSRLDFVCSDGRSAMPAARRIRGWIAGAGVPSTSFTQTGPSSFVATA